MDDTRLSTLVRLMQTRTGRKFTTKYCVPVHQLYIKFDKYEPSDKEWHGLANWNYLYLNKAMNDFCTFPPLWCETNSGIFVPGLMNLDSRGLIMSACFNLDSTSIDVKLLDFKNRNYEGRPINYRQKQILLDSQKKTIEFVAVSDKTNLSLPP